MKFLYRKIMLIFLDTVDEKNRRNSTSNRQKMKEIHKTGPKILQSISEEKWVESLQLHRSPLVSLHSLTFVVEAVVFFLIFSPLNQVIVP